MRTRQTRAAPCATGGAGAILSPGGGDVIAVLLFLAFASALRSGHNPSGRALRPQLALALRFYASVPAAPPVLRRSQANAQPARFSVDGTRRPRGAVGPSGGAATRRLFLRRACWRWPPQRCRARGPCEHGAHSVVDGPLPVSVGIRPDAWRCAQTGAGGSGGAVASAAPRIPAIGVPGPGTA